MARMIDTEEEPTWEQAVAIAAKRYPCPPSSR
jgi:hypothetical protein